MQNLTVSRPTAEDSPMLSILWRADKTANFESTKPFSIPLNKVRTSAYLKDEFDRFGAPQPIPVFWPDLAQFGLYIQWARDGNLDTSSLGFTNLLELWLLGDMLKDVRFKDTVISYLVHMVSQPNADPTQLIALLDPQTIKQIWDLTTQRSQLRSFVVDMVALFGSPEQISQYRVHYNELRAFIGALTSRLDSTIPASVIPRKPLPTTIRDGNTTMGEAVGSGPLANYTCSLFGRCVLLQDSPPVDLRPDGHSHIKRILLPSSGFNAGMFGIGVDGAVGWDNKFDKDTLRSFTIMSNNMFKDTCRYHEHGYDIGGPGCPTSRAWSSHG